MKLKDLLVGVSLTSELLPGVADIDVSGLAYDSRKAGPGTLFFAFAGAKVDGADFAAAAIAKGAIGVVGDRPRPPGFHDTWIQVSHGRRALAVAAWNFYNKPDERIALTAVTGTNGKTTSALLIDSILRAAGKTTALIGTIEYHLGGRILPAVNTTPESLDLFRMFHELELAGGTHATLEASSHALDLGRIYAMRFHTAAFTNLTRDHLDYHHTMEAYFAAKRLLFEPKEGPPPRFAVVNMDDEWGRLRQPAAGSEVFWFGIDQKPPGPGRVVRALNIQSSFDGLRFDVDTGDERFTLESPLVGRFNVYNILLACATALSYGINVDQIQQGVKQLASVPGRFERVDEGQPFMVVVDYAHTDDALRNVIAAARKLKPKRIITLFGCGGDRDRSKRPLMGIAAAEASDFVILTSDNPRSEDPLAIMNDATIGLQRFDTPHVAEPDREKAIRRAIQEAKPGDVIIIAGKGHETYQLLKDGPISFDDREVARRVLRGLGYSRQPHPGGN